MNEQQKIQAKKKKNFYEDPTTGSFTANGKTFNKEGQVVQEAVTKDKKQRMTEIEAKTPELVALKQRATASGVKEAGDTLTPEMARLQRISADIEEEIKRKAREEVLKGEIPTPEIPTTQQAPTSQLTPTSTNPLNPLSVVPQALTEPVTTAGSVLDPRLQQGQTAENKIGTMAAAATVGGAAAGLGAVGLAAAGTSALAGVAATSTTLGSITSTWLGTKVISGTRSVFRDQVGDARNDLMNSRKNIRAIISDVNNGGDPLEAAQIFNIELQNLKRIKKSLKQLNEADITGLNGADNAYADYLSYEKMLVLYQEKLLRAINKPNIALGETALEEQTNV